MRTTRNLHFLRAYNMNQCATSRVLRQPFTGFLKLTPDSTILPHLLWPPCAADADVIFSSYGFFFRSFFFLLFSSPNLSGRKLNVYHTSTRDVVIITWRRSFAEYRKYFVARFNDVHAIGYNSAGSERIWMKFGELRVYCSQLELTDFGCDPRRRESGRPRGSFFFFVR